MNLQNALYNMNFKTDPKINEKKRLRDLEEYNGLKKVVYKKGESKESFDIEKLIRFEKLGYVLREMGRVYQPERIIFITFDGKRKKLERGRLEEYLTGVCSTCGEALPITDEVIPVVNKDEEELKGLLSKETLHTMKHSIVTL